MGNRENQALETLTKGRLHIRRYEPSDKRAVRRLHDDASNEVGAHPGRVVRGMMTWMRSKAYTSDQTASSWSASWKGRSSQWVL